MDDCCLLLFCHSSLSQIKNGSFQFFVFLSWQLYIATGKACCQSKSTKGRNPTQVEIRWTRSSQNKGCSYPKKYLQWTAHVEIIHRIVSSWSVNHQIGSVSKNCCPVSSRWTREMQKGFGKNSEQRSTYWYP